MNTDKTRICVLYDIYGDLLPASSADLIDLYYNDDLSLSEAAENVGISRQGVRAGILRGIQQLEEYESKLGLYDKYKKNKNIITKILNELDAGGIDTELRSRLVSLLDSLSF